jgi:acetoin utilization protein AcuB
MTWGVITTRPDAPLAEAALLMSERRVGSLPVVEQGRLVGMLTERDVLAALGRDGKVGSLVEGFLWI